MLIRGALANALAFTCSFYLFSRLSKDSIDKERKRHDLKSLHFILAQSGNFIIATTCPLKFS